MAPKQDKVKKMVEDKTFGMKNKNKSAKVAQFVQQLQKQAQGNAKQQRAASANPSVKDKKKMEEEKKKELDALFTLAIKQPKVPEGVDPKSVLCEFFKHGRCEKGFKCKYVHSNYRRVIAR